MTWPDDKRFNAWESEFRFVHGRHLPKKDDGKNMMLVFQFVILATVSDDEDLAFNDLLHSSHLSKHNQKSTTFHHTTNTISHWIKSSMAAISITKVVLPQNTQKSSLSPPSPIMKHPSHHINYSAPSPPTPSHYTPSHYKPTPSAHPPHHKTSQTQTPYSVHPDH